MNQEDEANDLFHNGEWKRFVKQAEEAKEALMNSCLGAKDVRTLGQIQGQVLQLSIIIHYEESRRAMWALEKDAETVEF